MLILGNQFVPFSKAIFEQLNPIETARDPKYSLVRATYRTITTMNKGLIDRKEPNTFSLISKLSENKKYNHHALGEHVKNMISLQKRLRRIESGNIQDRKKNPYDPIAHPSLFFRRKEELQDILTRNLSPKAVVFSFSFDQYPLEQPNQDLPQISPEPLSKRVLHNLGQNQPIQQQFRVFTRDHQEKPCREDVFSNTHKHC
eukprot:TRINITY_DN105319_c1_g1_i1.p3 TRINITY_DN105319_c1_g1~~TRINITY_DN105319_c1_g1_i1.p3  ORF type:complete len:201 (-),score=0.17 TRINITY_DN105319_c1_g1_i1:653-1255(-)